MARLVICSFGSFRVMLDNVPLNAFESDKVRALLVYLAVEAGQAQRREHLAALLWPEQPEERARRSLSQALYNLRSVLQEPGAGTSPFLLVTPDTIQFDPTSDYWLDIAEFSRLVEACERHAHPTLEACQFCQECFKQAMSLYREEFLADLTIRDSATFDEWALVWRERTRLLASRALASLAGCYEQQGHLQEALLAARRLAELEPYDDGASQQLMRLLAACGKHSEALAHYEKFRLRLQAELEIAPQTETHALSERIRRMRSAKAGTASRTHNLPAALSPLIGREDELAELQGRLLDPACRLLTVLGPGGSGKSRLALEAARGLIERFAHGACLVSLSPLAALEAVVPSVAKALDLEIKGEKAPLEQVQNYLRQKELLLLMDGCEGLLESAPIFVEMLHAVPGLKILATSRTRLNIEEEQVYLLGGLKCPSLEDLTHAASSGAVRLFASGARRVRPDFGLDSLNLKAVVEICNEVQGMPLAILLAAAWVEVLSPAEILAEMSLSLDFLQGEWSDLPLRQRSMRLTFDYSWNLLEEAERAVFRGLCVFRGAFTRQAALAVSGAKAAELRRLVDKSMVMPQSGEWYAVHDLLRQYGLEKLRENPTESSRLHQRYSAYYLEKLAIWEADLKGARLVETLALLDSKINDLRSVWGLACEFGDSERLSGALEGLCLYYERNTRLAEGRSLCQETISVLAQSQTPAERLLLARVLAWQSRFLRLLGEMSGARQSLEESQTLLEGLEGSGLDTRAAQAFAHLEAGEGVFLADLASAQRHLENSLGLYRSLGDTWRTARVLCRLGVNHHYAGDYPGSDMLLSEARELYRSIGAAAGIAEAQRIMTQNQIRMGNIGEALDLMRQTIASTQATLDRAQAAQDRRTLATILVWNGQFEETVPLLQEAMDTAEDLGDQFEMTFISCLLGGNLMSSGQYDHARRQVDRSLELARSNHFQREAGVCLWYQGCMALVEGSPQEARLYFRESITLCRPIGNPDELAWALSLDAFCCLLLGEVEQTRRLLIEALEITISIHGYLSTLLALIVGASWLGSQGEAEKALEVYEAAAHLPILANSVWIHELFGKYIAACTEGLSPELAAAARERGRQRQLWDTVEEMDQTLRAAIRMR